MSSDGVKNVGAFLFAGVLGLAIVISALLLNGLVLSQLWQWFITPLGAPNMGVLQAVGVTLAARLVLYQDCAKSESPQTIDPRVYWLITTYVHPLAFLFVGWLVQLCL